MRVSTYQNFLNISFHFSRHFSIKNFYKKNSFQFRKLNKNISRINKHAKCLKELNFDLSKKISKQFVFEFVNDS